MKKNKIDISLLDSKRNTLELKGTLYDYEKRAIMEIVKKVGYEKPFILSAPTAKSIDCYKLSLNYFFEYQLRNQLELYGKILKSDHSELRKMGLVIGEYEVFPKHAQKRLMIHALFQDITLSNEEADKRTKAICLETIPWVKKAEDLTNKRIEKQKNMQRLDSLIHIYSKNLLYSDDFTTRSNEVENTLETLSNKLDEYREELFNHKNEIIEMFGSLLEDDLNKKIDQIKNFEIEEGLKIVWPSYDIFYLKTNDHQNILSKKEQEFISFYYDFREQIGKYKLILQQKESKEQDFSDFMQLGDVLKIFTKSFVDNTVDEQEKDIDDLLKSFIKAVKNLKRLDNKVKKSVLNTTNDEDLESLENF